MQPYFLPYLGYFQLIREVDEFVVYDNIQFVKKGWIHRNRILVNGSASMFTIPLKSDSDYLDINQRELAGNFSIERDKLLRRVESAYRTAPNFREAMPIIVECLTHSDKNLFRFVYHALQKVLAYLQITTPLRVSSCLNIDRNLKGQERVIATCKALNATHYINSPGGKDLYSSKNFTAAGLDLSFLEPSTPAYRQFHQPFVANLSIIDVIMFNPKRDTGAMLNSYSVQRA